MVLDILKSHIEQRLEADGTIAVPRGNGRVAYVQPDELEFNNIVGMAYAGLVTKSQRESQAVNVCKCAKSVRDEISHLRAPDSQRIIQLIQEMDSLLP